MHETLYRMSPASENATYDNLQKYPSKSCKSQGLSLRDCWKRIKNILQTTFTATEAELLDTSVQFINFSEKWRQNLDRLVSLTLRRTYPTESFGFENRLKLSRLVCIEKYGRFG